MPRSAEVTPDLEREAHKMNALVQREDVSASEASTADDERFDQLISQIFDRKYWIDIDSLAVEAKPPGQKAEDIIIDLLNRHPLFRAEHASDEEDQRGKIDIKLWVEGEEHPILIQMTTLPDGEEVERKRRLTPPEALFVQAQSASSIVGAMTRERAREMQAIAERFLRGVFAEMRHNPHYENMFNRIQRRVLGARG